MYCMYYIYFMYVIYISHILVITCNIYYILVYIVHTMYVY